MLKSAPACCPLPRLPRRDGQPCSFLQRRGLWETPGLFPLSPSACPSPGAARMPPPRARGTYAHPLLPSQQRRRKFPAPLALWSCLGSRAGCQLRWEGTLGPLASHCSPFPSCLLSVLLVASRGVSGTWCRHYKSTLSGSRFSLYLIGQTKTEAGEGRGGKTDTCRLASLLIKPHSCWKRTGSDPGLCMAMPVLSAPPWAPAIFSTTGGFLPLRHLLGSLSPTQVLGQTGFHTGTFLLCLTSVGTL